MLPADTRRGIGLLVLVIQREQVGVNTVTGQFSCGAAGLMIRDGELAEPVRETTVAATLPVILDGIVAIADDLRILPGGATGRTLLVGEMAVSGT